MVEQYRQYLNRLHNCEFTVINDPTELNVVRYYNEPNAIVVTVRSEEANSEIIANIPNADPVVAQDNHDRIKLLLERLSISRKHTINTMLLTGFGIGFAAGMLVTVVSNLLFT